MITRFTLVAALLGVAAVTAADASAATRTVVKSVGPHAAGKTTKIVVHKLRPHAATRIVKHVRLADRLRIVHRAPVRAKLVKFLATKAQVRVIKHPVMQRQVLAHRSTAKTTVIR